MISNASVDVLLKAHDELEDMMRSYTKKYKLQLIEQNIEIEEITAQARGMQHNEQNTMAETY